MLADFDQSLDFGQACELVREYLRREIARRVPEPEDCVDLECEQCGGEVFTLSYRRASDRKGKTILRHDCAHPKLTAPTPQDHKWVGKLETETRGTALAGLAALR